MAASKSLQLLQLDRYKINHVRVEFDRESLCLDTSKDQIRGEFILRTAILTQCSWLHRPEMRTGLHHIGCFSTSGRPHECASLYRKNLCAAASKNDSAWFQRTEGVEANNLELSNFAGKMDKIRVAKLDQTGAALSHL